MKYRTVMVQLDLDESPDARTQFALHLANRFQAGLIGFCAAQPRRPIAPMDGAIIAAELMQRETEDIEARQNEIRHAFESIAGIGENASFRQAIGDPTRLVVDNSPAADLIVTGYGTQEKRDTFHAADIGELILSTGRPVLVASSSLKPLDGERVLVAWKNTREARRAVVDALPFLTQAHDVLVATMEEKNSPLAKDSLEEVVEFLKKHGVKAYSRYIHAANDSVGDTLSAIAFESGADLIVSGGYGHSRLREWAFGGVTRRLLGATSLNRLLCY